MRTAVDTYNYARYDWSLQQRIFEGWPTEAPRLGSQAPLFELLDLDGRRHRLSRARGRAAVIEFGSFTCAIFRAQCPAMEALAAARPEFAFYVVYTREAHPGERVGAHRSREEKVAAAVRLAEEERIARTLLVDGLDGRVHRAYGAVWDSVFVVDADGAVVLRRAWNAPDEVASALDAIGRGERLEGRESLELPSILNPVGFGHGLLRGGRRAVLDLYESGPPDLRRRLRESDSDEVRQAVAGR